MKAFRCQICQEVYIGKDKPKGCPFCGAHQSYFVPAKEWSWLKADKLSDITKENLNKALELEIDNANFYRAVSEKSQDIYVQSVFKGLAKVEWEHASTIVKHLGIAKPDFTLSAAQCSGSEQKNIQEANQREKRAVKFYGEALNQAPEPQMKEFFEALVMIESDHIVLTQRM